MFKIISQVEEIDQEEIPTLTGINEDISYYINKYPRLKEVPLSVLDGYIRNMPENFQDKDLYILQILLFWGNYSELIGSNILSEYKDLIFSIINNIKDLNGLGNLLANNYDNLSKIEDLPKILLIFGNDYSYVMDIEDLKKIDIALFNKDINNYNNLADFLVTYKDSLNFHEVKSILYNWDKLSDKEKMDPGEILLGYIQESKREFLKNNYPEEMYPYFLRYPTLFEETDVDVVKDLIEDIKDRQTLSNITIHNKLTLLKIFGNNKKIIDQMEFFLKPYLDRIPYFKDRRDYEGMGNFLIELKDYLNLNLLSRILFSWDKIEKRDDIKEILLKDIPEEEKEILRKYPIKDIPILITDPSLIHEDPELVRNIFNKKTQERYQFALTDDSVRNTGKLIKIFGEDYYKAEDDLEIRSSASFIPYYEDKSDYEGMREFLIQFKSLLNLSSMQKILDNWKNLKGKNFSELMLSEIPEDKRERVIRSRYPVESYPLLIEIPALIGVNPQLIDEALEGISNKSIDLSYKRSYIKDTFKLLSIFGKDYKNIIKDDDNFINDNDYNQIHELANHLPNYVDRNDYKYLDLYLRKNKNWDDGIVKVVMNNWNKFPEELRKIGDTNTLYQYFIDSIVPSMINTSKVTDKDFALEAFTHDIKPENYNRIEKYYLIGQKVPLPKWAMIEPVIIKGYIGHFLPRSDKRTMFIGDYVTCCQKIGSNAENSAVHSQVSPYGALFLIENMKTRKPTAQSWVWENRGNVVFDDIECPAMKGEDSNDRIAGIIMGIYKEVARRIKELGMKSVSVGYAQYGANLEYLKDLPKMEEEFVEGPEDEKSFVKEYFGEEEDGLYMDSDEEKRFLASIYNKMLRISNRIDGENSDISDKIDRLIFGE